MKIITLSALFLFCIAVNVGAQNASVSGRVELPKGIKAPMMTKHYEIVSKGGILAPNPPVAIVYLEGEFSKSSNAAVRQIIQTNFTFVPSLLPIEVGTKVEFPNHDDAFHNIFSYSPAKRFDLGRYRSEDRPIPFQVFDKPGLITLRCDIHEHMRALILVLQTPYFVTTGTDGRFELSGLPEGHFLLKAWLNSSSILEEPVDLRNGVSLKVDFSSEKAGDAK